MNNIHPTAIINWDNVTIGDGNNIGPYVCIGTDAQHKSENSNGIVEIGDGNTFREYVSVHRPLNDITKIGNNNYIMCNSHIAHDCVLENDISLTAGVILTGGVVVMNGANIGSGATVHQGQIIGSFSMIGMNSVVVKKSDVLPGEIYAGVPIKNIGKNVIGLERNNIDNEHLESEIKRFYKIKNGLEK